MVLSHLNINYIVYIKCEQFYISKQKNEPLLLNQYVVKLENSRENMFMNKYNEGDTYYMYISRLLSKSTFGQVQTV